MWSNGKLKNDNSQRVPLFVMSVGGKKTDRSVSCDIFHGGLRPYPTLFPAS